MLILFNINFSQPRRCNALPAGIFSRWLLPVVAGEDLGDLPLGGVLLVGRLGHAKQVYGYNIYIYTYGCVYVYAYVNQ